MKYLVNTIAVLDLIIGFVTGMNLAWAGAVIFASGVVILLRKRIP